MQLPSSAGRDRGGHSRNVTCVTAVRVNAETGIGCLSCVRAERATRGVGRERSRRMDALS